MQFVETNELGRSIQLVLNKAEIVLKTNSPNGIMFDYGDGYKEYIYSFETRMSKKVQMGNRWLHYDYYSLRLNSGISVGEVISASVNMEGDDNLLNKTATVKKVDNALYRIDFAGNASSENLSDAARTVKLTLRLVFRSPTT